MIYIGEMENQTGQKVDGSPAPYSPYSAEARLPEVIFGSVEKARTFAARFMEALTT